jgi:hypothetical protein
MRLYARSYCLTPAAWRANATIAQAASKDRMSEDLGAGLNRLRRRTGPYALDLWTSEFAA